MVKYESKLKANLKGYLFSLPQIAGISILVYAGILFMVFLSFTNWSFYGGLDFSDIKFMGLKNYQYILEDDKFVSAIITNSFLVLMVPVTAFCSLVLGSAMNSKFIYERGLRAAIFIPNICNIVAIVMIWSALFHTRLSPISGIMQSLGMEPPIWFATPWNARILIYLMNLWRAIGFFAFIYIGALNAIPTHLYEAAKVEGAGTMTRFFKITLPLVSPTTLFVIITESLNTLKHWAPVMLLTDGGPGHSTYVFGSLMYKFAFGGNAIQDLGASSALAVMVVALAGIITTTNWKIQDKWVNYS
ncbi:MAG: sugar ABC transporter permease [Firmicutes bacterium]|nr:sugar ABC transporter permease [Bacillota bacterium]